MHILKIGAGESLAKCISQFLGQCVQRLLTVVGPLRESLFIFADDSSDMSIGVEQLAVDLESHITTGGFQHRANLLNNRREVVGKFQILLIHNHLLPFKVITFSLLYAIAGGCQTKDLSTEHKRIPDGVTEAVRYREPVWQVIGKVVGIYFAA